MLYCISVIFLTIMLIIVLYTVRFLHTNELERLSMKIKRERVFRQFIDELKEALSDNGCYCDASEYVETPEDVTIREVLDILELQNQRIMTLEDKYEKLNKKYKKLKNSKKLK